MDEIPIDGITTANIPCKSSEVQLFTKHHHVRDHLTVVRYTSLHAKDNHGTIYQGDRHRSDDTTGEDSDLLDGLHCC